MIGDKIIRRLYQLDKSESIQDMERLRIDILGCSEVHWGIPKKHG